MTSANLHQPMPAEALALDLFFPEGLEIRELLLLVSEQWSTGLSTNNKLQQNDTLQSPTMGHYLLINKILHLSFIYSPTIMSGNKRWRIAFFVLFFFTYGLLQIPLPVLIRNLQPMHKYNPVIASVVTCSVDANRWGQWQMLFTAMRNLFVPFPFPPLGAYARWKILCF